MRNILHISDIHVSCDLNRGMPSHKLKQLLKDLITDLASYQKIDLILITGDIANSGAVDEYNLFNDVFLNPLLEELSLDFNKVIVAPGNHDLNRVAWKASDKAVKDNLLANVDQSKVQAILEEIVHDDSCKRIDAFLKFREHIDSTKSKSKLLSNPIFSVYEIDGVGIGVINSAWLAYEGDYGKLLIGEWQVRQVLKSLERYKQKILVLHHPLDWLHPDDRRVVSDLILRASVKSMFYGHMHEFSMLKLSQFAEDSLLKLQAGRLDISKNDEYGGYSILSLHENNKFENGRIVFRKYDWSHSKFVPWNARVNNGEMDYSLDDSVPFNTAAFAVVCENKIKNIEFDLICNTGLVEEKRKKLSEIFVLPALELDDQSVMESEFDAGQTDSNVNKALTLPDLINSSHSHIIFGAENSGKTTLAKRILLSYLTEQTHENLRTIVYYLDLNKANLKNTNQINNQLLDFYTGDENAKIFSQRLEKKLNSPDAVIIFDSLNALDKTSMKVLGKYLVQNKGAKFYLLGQLSIRTALMELISEISTKENIDINFKLLNVKSIQRGQIRDLFEKWTLGRGTENDKSVKKALKVISGAGMPSNPFVYTMLLSISDRKSITNQNFMHEADLVENFIESILNKHVQYADHNVAQYKDILLFLGFIADKMHQSGNYFLEHNDLWAHAIEFNGLIDQKFKIEGYIDPVIESGVLKKEKDIYIFSQVCFFNYAYAKWIENNLADYESLDRDLDFIRFDKVIEYLSALKKSDVKLLEYLSNKVDKAWNALLEETDLTELQSAEAEMTKAVQHDLIDLIDHDKMETSLVGNHKSKQEVDEILDKVDPLNDQPVKDIKPYEHKLDPSVYFYESLSLYARSFRAAEHILVPQYTSLHFNKVLDFYMKSLAYTVRIFDQQARPIVLKKLKSILKYESLDLDGQKVAKNQIEAFFNFVIATLPNLNVSMMTSDFFNQRQQTKMIKFRNEVDNNLAKILLTFCLCELDGVDILKEIKSQRYEKPHESSSLLMKAMALKNFDFTLSNDDKDALVKFAAGVLKKRKELKKLVQFSVLATKMGEAIK